jgi:hypothetical protein
MKIEDDYYKQVEQEINEGKYQEGLRTKVLVQADGDENKARVLYIKLRVESLKAEEMKAVRDAKRQIEQEHLAKLNLQLENLSHKLENLSHIIRRRKMIHGGGIVIGFTVGIMIGIVERFDLAFALFIGAIFASFGYAAAIIYCYCMPTQRYLNKIEIEITKIRDEKTDLSISPTRRFIKRWISSRI